MGIVSKDSREFRGPVELFLASVAGWEGDVVRLVMGKRSICPSDDPLGLGWRPGLPEDVQVSVAGSLSVLQVLAQIIDRFDIAARFAFDARVAQVADQPV